MIGKCEIRKEKLEYEGPKSLGPSTAQLEKEEKRHEPITNINMNQGHPPFQVPGGYNPMFGPMPPGPPGHLGMPPPYYAQYEAGPPRTTAPGAGKAPPNDLLSKDSPPPHKLSVIYSERQEESASQRNTFVDTEADGTGTGSQAPRVVFDDKTIPRVKVGFAQKAASHIESKRPPPRGLEMQPEVIEVDTEMEKIPEEQVP